MNSPAKTKTGLKGLPVDQIVERFFGDISRWPVEPTNNLSFTQAQIALVCQHMSDTGDCLWHAQYIVMNWDRCDCAACAEGRQRGPYPVTV